jgi:hypothetical protein
MNDLKPLPRPVQWWRKSRNRRQTALTTFKNATAKALTLAISVAGAMLISYGVYSVYPPAGFLVAGVLVWVLQWSYERDRSSE